MAFANKIRKPIIALSVLLLMLAIAFLAAMFVNSNLADQPIVSSIPPDLGTQVTFKILNQYPHDPQAFTQGLIFHEGCLYESTGLYTRSSLRKVDLETGEVLQSIPIDEHFFAEGLTLWQDTLVQLTWKEMTGWVYDLDGFERLSSFTYPGEGWGLTQDGTHLIMSDGTHQIRFLDPETFSVIRQIDVLEEGKPLTNLNELEYIHGEIFANVWQTDIIIRINPADGSVLGRIDLTGLLPREELSTPADVLNGIAYDPASDRLFVTGKLWPYLYEIALVNQTSAE
jgi:glutamine cyclotransferase